MLLYSGVFRGHGAMPFISSDHKNFLQTTLYEKVRFCRFSANFIKMGEFAAFIERSKTKSVSASGGLRPALTPRPGALPLHPAGGSAPDRPYRLALCALAMAPLCQVLNTPLLLY